MARCQLSHPSGQCRAKATDITLVMLDDATTGDGPLFLPARACARHTAWLRVSLDRVVDEGEPEQLELDLEF